MRQRKLALGRPLPSPSTVALELTGAPVPVPREELARAGPLSTLRERAAQALDDDFPNVLAALRHGLSDRDAGKAARTAVAYVQLVYGRQLQQPADEQPADPLDVSQMTREQRDALKRKILAQHPHLVDESRSS